RLRGDRHAQLPPMLLRGEQSNSSVAYGDQLILKLFRRIEQGLNPDLEIGRFLSDVADFPHVPAVAGALEYQPNGDEPWTLAVLQSFARNQGTAWQYTLETLDRYYDQADVEAADALALPSPGQSLVDLSTEPSPSAGHERIGAYLQSAQLLGQRTAEL